MKKWNRLIVEVFQALLAGAMKQAHSRTLRCWRQDIRPICFLQAPSGFKATKWASCKPVGQTPSVTKAAETMAGAEKGQLLLWNITLGFEARGNWVSLLQTSSDSTDFSAFIRTSELLTHESGHTVFIIPNQQELQQQEKNKMGNVGQKWVYPAILPLAGTNPTWHFIYDVTCVQNEASEWQQCYLIATAEDMCLNCRTQFCKAAGETVKDESKSGLNVPTQPLRWDISVILRCSPLRRSWPFGLSHCCIRKSNWPFFNQLYNYNKRNSADGDEEDAWGVEQRFYFLFRF